MALARSRDPDEVVAGFVAWRREQEPGGLPDVAPEVVGVERPSAGFSSETYVLDVRRGDAEERLVLKLPPAGPGGFPSYDFAVQARVQTAVAAAGIPAPAPVVAVADERWLGAPFLVMPAVDGHIVDQIPLADRWLTKADSQLNTRAHQGYVDVIAAVNGVDWRAHGLADALPVRDNAAEIAHWRRYLAWYGDGADLVHSLIDALDWCDAHRPSTEPPPSLLWGDVRLGNVIYDDHRVPVAVLDWEMASIGAAEHDLAWTLALDGAQDELFGRRVPGFLDRAAVIERYETAIGRPTRDLDWYETFALARSIAIMTRIGHLHELAGEPGPFPLADNPMLALLQRRIPAT